MKALELTVYPVWDDGFGRLYADKDDRLHPVDVDFEVYRKRLTDTELAAEYYRAAFLHENSVAENDGYDGAPDVREYRRQTRTIHRFATRPHYDEDTHGNH